MPTTVNIPVTLADRAFNLVKDASIRYQQMTGTNLTPRAWTVERVRQFLVQIASAEKRMQDEEAARADNIAIDGEVTVA